MRNKLLVIFALFVITLIPVSGVRAYQQPKSSLAATLPENVLPPTIELFVRAPVGTYPTPYIILTALTTGLDSSELTISGTYNQSTFTCLSDQCAIKVEKNGTMLATATDQNGNSSKVLSAEIEVSQNELGFSTHIATLRNFIYFNDACGSAWGLVTNKPAWANFPNDPYELNTSKDLHFLGKQLYEQKAIDLSSCPNNGLLGAGLSACGLELARPHLEYWQNQFDLPIWRASGEVGIPPKILKTLIETETQFWPITSDNRFHIDEFGLAQITQNGIDVLLRNDPKYYYEVCNESIAPCDLPYASLPAEVQANLRSYLVNKLNTNCPTCAFGRSLDKAAASVDLIARVIKADCLQARPYLSYKENKLNYEDSWKVTLALYNAGVGCVQETYNKITMDGLDLTWDNFENNFTCVTGTGYVDKLWYSLITFDDHRKTDYALEFVEPALPVSEQRQGYSLSKGTLTVKAFQDLNGDGIMQDDEGLTGIEVLLTVPDRNPISNQTASGVAEFDLSGYSIGQRAKVSLIGYNKSTYIFITPEENQAVSFPFLPAIGQ